jgi:hypothetical protein
MNDEKAESVSMTLSLRDKIDVACEVQGVEFHHEPMGQKERAQLESCALSVKSFRKRDF